MFKLKKHHDLGFMLIAVIKLLKGLVLLVVGIALLSLWNGNLAESVKYWAHFLQIDLDGHFMQRLLARLVEVDRKDVRLVAGTTLFYSVLLLTEGIGLLYEKVWAEYMTFIITASFIPYEGYKLVSHATPARYALIAINTLAAAYLALRLHQRALAKQKAQAASLPTSQTQPS